MTLDTGAKSDATAVGLAQGSLPTAVSSRYVIAGGIADMVRVRGAVYIGGEFGRIANRTGSGIVVPSKGGQIERGGAEVAGGPVKAVVADGVGGWYVGGSFTTVGGVHRAGLAHVLANGTLDPVFAPPDLVEVRALALAGNVLVAAAAPQLDGSAVSRALDRTTGAALPIRYAPPQGARQVRVLLASGGRLFIGFGERLLAAYDPATGTRFWSRRLGRACPCAGQTGGVITLAAAGERLLVGGGFAEGRSRNFVALVAATGLVTGHSVRIPRRALSIAVVGGNAYVAYNRDHPGSSGLASVDLRTGRVRDWGVIRPGILAADSTRVYVEGELGKDERKPWGSAFFYGIYAARAGTAHARLRRVSPPLAGGQALAMAVQGGRLFVGGDFTGAGGPARHNLAAFDARSGKLLRWGPKSTPVTAMAAVRHTIYLGTVKLGEGHDRVAGAPRTGLAAVSADGAGRLLPWRPRLGYWSIRALAAGAGRVFVGGSLTFPGAEKARFTDVAAFSARGTGRRLPFSVKLGFEDDVSALTVWRRTLIVGGQNVIAYSVDGHGRHELWRRPADYVFSFATRGATLYAGGSFDRVDRKPRKNLAAFALDRHGALLPFAPKVPIVVHALALLGSDIVCGGEGDTNTYRKQHQVLGAVTLDGKLEQWHVDVPPDGVDVEHLAPIKGGLLAGGYFNWLGPEGHQAAGGIAWLR